MKYVCVTEDANVHSGGTSELGVSCAESKATRRILESYTTRVYLIRKHASTDDPRLAKDVDEFRASLREVRSTSHDRIPSFDDPTMKNHTQYCASVCPLDELYFDILRWRAEAFPS